MATKQNRPITEAQIAAWKKQYNDDIHEISVEKDGTKYKCVVRRPNLIDLQAAEEFAKDDTIKQNLFVFKQCYLGGDTQFLNDDELRLAAAIETAIKFRFLKATSKKL